MVVIALIGILAGITVAGISGMRPNADFRNAVHDLSSRLSLAQARAVSTGGDVWVIFYTKRPNVAADTAGGVIVYEDPDRDFAASFAAFSPPGNTFPEPVENTDRIEFHQWFAESPYANRVKVLPNSAGNLTLNSPFSGALPSCNFCGGTGKGAIVYTADGAVRFIDGAGTPVTTVPVGVMGLRNENGRTAALAVAPTTGFFRVTER